MRVLPACHLLCFCPSGIGQGTAPPLLVAPSTHQLPALLPMHVAQPWGKAPGVMDTQSSSSSSSWGNQPHGRHMWMPCSVLYCKQQAS